ncbi:MAG: NAD(P)-dependent oxidoreductase [Burkholderiales bacterium]|nr:NAD(P)-dependent oxidoreductase [Burkholderiales bacterium]
MADDSTLGFIGLGVMGEPICRNLARKSGRMVRAHDRDPARPARLAAHGVAAVDSAGELAAQAGIVFLCLPSGSHVESLCDGPAGLVARARPGQVFVDLGTSPVRLARRLAGDFAARGAAFADAPIARTREAAQQGTLSVMVGADPAVYERLLPLIETFASDVTHCGPAGAGQALKILNNMVLTQTVNALAEALAMGRRLGIAPALLFDTLAKGSADSFALRNHGMKAMLPGTYPEQAFSTEYMQKDIRYALELARDTGVAAPGAQLGADVLQQAIDAGFGAQYWPVIARVVDRAGDEVSGTRGAGPTATRGV